MQRGTLLGTLAAEQYKNAIDLHNLAMDQYNKTEDRRYMSAADRAKMEYDAQVQNANNSVSLLGGGGKVEPTDEEKNASDGRKGARKTFDSLNTKISELKTKLTPVNKTNPDAPRKLVIQTPDGKKQLRALRAERDRLKKAYGF